MPLWSSSSNPNSGDPYAPPNDGDGSDFNAILAPYKPLIKTLSLSSLMGYCSAIAAKRIGKHVAFIAGVGFIVLQGLVHKRFIDVNWKEVQKSVADAVDTVSSFSALLLLVLCGKLEFLIILTHSHPPIKLWKIIVLS